MSRCRSPRLGILSARLCALSSHAGKRARVATSPAALRGRSRRACRSLPRRGPRALHQQVAGHVACQQRLPWHVVGCIVVEEAPAPAVPGGLLSKVGPATQKLKPMWVPSRASQERGFFVHKRKERPTHTYLGLLHSSPSSSKLVQRHARKPVGEVFLLRSIHASYP